MLVLKDIKKDYVTAAGSVSALKGISLEFRANEFVSVLGASGCGKTTLLNIIGGLDRYTSGDLIINGVSTKAYRDRDWDVYRNHRIGFIFQSYNLIPHQTVLGNVELALTIAGVSKSERRKRAADALRRVGLGKELKKRPNQLSGGQMQRVAIARALVNNPEILLADEPTGALDTETSVQIMELIREIAGERLVIMVTHNPELAEQYSSRIVRLKDGLVVSDTCPYDSEAERKELLAKIKEKGITDKQIKAWKKAKNEGKRTKEKAAMSHATALGLSGRNLRAKKNRTFVTSLAGSIGIIGVSLVLALSGGFNSYIANTEKDMLSAYPVTITETTLNYASIISTMEGGTAKVELDKLNDKIYINSFLTRLANGMMSTNAISEEYLEYLRQIDKGNYYDMQLLYGGNIGNNLFKNVTFSQTQKNPATGESVSVEYNYDMSLTTLLSMYQGQLETEEGAQDYGSFAAMFGTVESVTYQLPDNEEYILSQYDVVAGEYPEANSENELVLVVNNNGSMTDLVLAQLGLLSLEEVVDLFQKSEAGDDSIEFVSYEKLLENTYTYYPNDSVYKKGKVPAVDASGMPVGFQDAWVENGFTNDKMPMIDKSTGTELKIGCILRAKQDVAYGSLMAGLAYTKAFANRYHEDCKTSAVAAEKTSQQIYRLDLIKQGYVSSLRTLRQLGAEELPNEIKIFVKDFDCKDAVTSHLDKWNDEIKKDDEGAQIQYTDTVAILMTLVRSMLDAVTYVLVAFTAISLVVSSVMIGVITYVSVVERTKEIGVLRSLGARKKDIRRLFNAETFLIGLFSGAIGVGFTYLASVPINLILGSLTGISTLAALPLHEGLIMVCVSIVLTLISGLVPAQAAARKDPVIALRTE